MKLSKRVLVLVSTTVVTADMVSGCGGDNRTSVTAVPSAGSQAAGGEVAGNQAAKDDGAESKVPGRIEAGGSLTIAIPQLHNTFFMPQSTTAGDRFGAQPILESLGYVGTGGNYFPWPTGEFIMDPDNPTFTIRLRDGAKSHDGSVYDGEAVAWNIQQYTDNSKTSEVGTSREIRAMDGLAVQIQHDEWASNQDNVIGDVYTCSKEAYEKNGVEWCQTHAVGTGPFILESFITDSKITHTENEDYRIEGQLYINHLEIDMITDINIMMSILSNEGVGVAMKSENNAIINAAEQAGFESAGRKNADVADVKHIIWNSKSDKHPMGDLKVRQAIVHAIQWGDVVGVLLGRLGGSTSLFCTSDSWTYAPDAKFYECGPDSARQMLAETDYPSGFETTICTKAIGNDTITAFQTTLAQIGIKAEVNIIDSSVLAVIQKEGGIDGFIADREANKIDLTNNCIHFYSLEGIENHGIMLRPAGFEGPLFAARTAKAIGGKKANLREAAGTPVQGYVMITLMAVVYCETFAIPELEDDGTYDVSLEQ